LGLERELALEEPVPHRHQVDRAVAVDRRQGDRVLPVEERVDLLVRHLDLVALLDPFPHLPRGAAVSSRRLAHAHAISSGRSLLAGIPGSLTLTPSPLGVRYSPGYPARSRSRHPPRERLDDARRALAALDLDGDEHLGLDAALHVGDLLHLGAGADP